MGSRTDASDTLDLEEDLRIESGRVATGVRCKGRPDTRCWAGIDGLVVISVDVEDKRHVACTGGITAGSCATSSNGSDQLIRV